MERDKMRAREEERGEREKERNKMKKRERRKREGHRGERQSPVSFLFEKKLKCSKLTKSLPICVKNKTGSDQFKDCF